MFKRWSVLKLIFIGFSFGIRCEGTDNVAYKAADDFLSQSYNRQNLFKMNSRRVGSSKYKTLQLRSERFLMELSDSRKKEIVSNLFRKNGKLKFANKGLENSSLEELNVIIDSDLSRQRSLYQVIDRTETAAGSVVLSAMLSNPVSDLSVIKERQALLKFLLENEEVFNHLNGLIRDVKEGQDSLLNCWNEEADLDGNVKNLIYSPKTSKFAFLNKLPIYHQLDKIASFLEVAGIAMAAPSMLSALFVLPISSVILLIAGEIPGSFCTGTLSLGALIAVLNGKEFVNHVKLMHKTLFIIHQRLRHISSLTESFDELFYTIRNHEDIYKGLSLANNLSDFVIDPGSISKNFNNLKKYLNRSLFDKEKFGIFSHAGTVIATYGYMEEAQDSYILPLEAIGELDAYLSIVRLIKEHRTKGSGFCFVDFVEQDAPLMKLNGAWSMLIGAEKAKPFSIILGDMNNPNNALFTGPIGSGKSSLIHTIASCDILGRVFGIAPSKKATMTMFDGVCTYVNIKDSSKSGFSPSMNERAKGIEIMNYIKNNPTKKILAIIDGPYNSLIDESGEIFAYDLATKIAKYPNVSCLFATKYKKPTDLAEETGKFANYHFDISEDNLNDFDRTFNLLPGKCDWWFNDVAKRNRYIQFVD